MKIKQYQIGVLIVVILFAGIGLFEGVGLWKTESDKTPSKFKEGLYEGQANPADIRGSYSFMDVSNAFGIEEDVLKEAFLIEPSVNASDVFNKDLESLYEGLEIGNGSVKAFVALYVKLPYDYEDDYLFESAVRLIEAKRQDLNESEVAYLRSHTIEDVSKIAEIVVDESSEEVVEENIIKGNTTFQQVLDMGVTQEKIEAILESEMPQSSLSIKNYCLENGFDFSVIKSKLEAEITN